MGSWCSKFNKTLTERTNNNLLSVPDSSSSTESNTWSDTEETDDEIYTDRIRIYTEWRTAIESNDIVSANKCIIQYLCGKDQIDLFRYVWSDDNNNGDNALHIACKTQKHLLAFFLLTSGMNVYVNQQNTTNGYTPLHYSAELHDKKMTELLVKFNANCNIFNHKHKSAKCIAFEYEIQTIITKWLCQINDKYQLCITLPLDIVQMILLYSKYTTYNEKIYTDNYGTDNVFGKAMESIGIKQGTEQLVWIGNLPLQTYLMKKRQTVPYNWSQRWFVVTGLYLFEDITQRYIKNWMDPMMRRRFLRCVHLELIKSVYKVKSAMNNKFEIEIKSNDKVNETNVMTLKADSMHQRDCYVMMLNGYIKHYKNIVDYLTN